MERYNYFKPSPVNVTAIQANQGTVSCKIYQFTVVRKRIHWTEPNRKGTKIIKETIFTTAYAFGPIDLLSIAIVETPAPGTYYGVTQRYFLSCNGRWRGFEKCQPPGVYEILEQAPSDFLFETIRIQGTIPNSGPPDPTPCRFRVTDNSGLLYDRTEAICPAWQVYCEGYCAPGGSRIGNCCVDCDDLTGNLEAIRQAVRRI